MQAAADDDVVVGSAETRIVKSGMANDLQHGIGDLAQIASGRVDDVGGQCLVDLDCAARAATSACLERRRGAAGAPGSGLPGWPRRDADLRPYDPLPASTSRVSLRMYSSPRATTQSSPHAVATASASRRTEPPPRPRVTKMSETLIRRRPSIAWSVSRNETPRARNCRASDTGPASAGRSDDNEDRSHQRTDRCRGSRSGCARPRRRCRRRTSPRRHRDHAAAPSPRRRTPAADRAHVERWLIVAPRLR